VEEPDDLLLTADVAVGDEHHLALRTRPDALERIDDRRVHLGTAVRLAAHHPGDGLLLLALRPGDCGARVAVCAHRELDHLEAIELGERVDEGCDDALSLGERTAAHRAARVEQHDEVTRRRLEGGIGRGRNDRQQRVGVAPVGHAAGGTRHLHGETDSARCHRPAHDDVAIETAPRCVEELDDAVGPRLQRMRRRFGAPPLGDGIGDAHLEMYATANGAVCQLDVRSAAIGLGDIGADVARTDDGREPQLPLALGLPRETLVDGDLADDGLARRDVAHLGREDVRLVLLEERRGLALDDRLLEPRACVLLPIDAARDGALADAERVAAHRTVDRQRHLVGDAKRVVVRVLEVCSRTTRARPPPASTRSFAATSGSDRLSGVSISAPPSGA
jgi:hypothetical protein